jgi:hypothetical protein
MQQVAGLAKQVHDSTTLQAAFKRIVAIEGNLSQKKTLDRRVATRWNIDFACLKTHVSFANEIKLFTSQQANGLQMYALTTMQWKLADQLIPVLEVCHLVSEVLPVTNSLLIRFSMT